MGNFKDLTGQKIGKLTIIKRVENKGKKVQWLCLCDCGTEIVVLADSINTGHTKSCGCAQRENVSIANKKHGDYLERLYRTLRNMKSRCYNENATEYNLYGGRGVRICSEWMDSEHGYENFKKWALENGYEKTLSIDRIDVDGNYEPSNCKWSSYTEQNRNKRNNRLITINGETKTLSEWCEALGMNEKTISARLCRLGWDDEVALMTPVGYQKSVCIRRKADEYCR